MNLDYFKSRLKTATRGISKLRYYFFDIFRRHLSWNRVPRIEWQHTWRQRYPAAICFIQRQTTAPGDFCRSLATRVGNLDSGYCAL